MESPADLYGQDVAAIFFPAPFFPSPRQTGAARTLYLRSEGPAGPLAAQIRDLVAGIDPRVPILELATLGGAAALLAAAMLLASILPARRAARLDPNVVLREE